jgi:hypothetical protein
MSINFLGRYAFSLPGPVAGGQLGSSGRPLRTRLPHSAQCKLSLTAASIEALAWRSTPGRLRLFPATALGAAI